MIVHGRFVQVVHSLLWGQLGALFGVKLKVPVGVGVVFTETEDHIGLNVGITEMWIVLHVYAIASPQPDLPLRESDYELLVCHHLPHQDQYTRRV